LACCTASMWQKGYWTCVGEGAFKRQGCTVHRTKAPLTLTPDGASIILNASVVASKGLSSNRPP
jgi:hypothetical protein